MLWIYKMFHKFQRNSFNVSRFSVFLEIVLVVQNYVPNLEFEKLVPVLVKAKMDKAENSLELPPK